MQKTPSKLESTLTPREINFYTENLAISENHSIYMLRLLSLISALEYPLSDITPDITPDIYGDLYVGCLITVKNTSLLVLREGDVMIRCRKCNEDAYLTCEPEQVEKRVLEFVNNHESKPK